jgi:hypothetical protein
MFIPTLSLYCSFLPLIKLPSFDSTSLPRMTTIRTGNVTEPELRRLLDQPISQDRLDWMTDIWSNGFVELTGQTVADMTAQHARSGIASKAITWLDLVDRTIENDPDCYVSYIGPHHREDPVGFHVIPQKPDGSLGFSVLGRDESGSGKLPVP